MKVQDSSSISREKQLQVIFFMTKSSDYIAEKSYVLINGGKNYINSFDFPAYQ